MSVVPGRPILACVCMCVRAFKEGDAWCAVNDPTNVRRIEEEGRRARGNRFPVCR